MWTNHPPLKRLNGLFGVWKDQEGNGTVFLVCSFLSLIPCSFLVPQSPKLGVRHGFDDTTPSDKIRLRERSIRAEDLHSLSREGF